MDIDLGIEGSPNREGGESSELKVKSSLRMRYAAETKVFTTQYGGLENIRQKLGFSRRKMCQLLLVDPSAWTRWCRDEAKVPPHIYRSLEWFLALNQKAFTQPDLAAIFTTRYRVDAQGRAGNPAVLKAEIDALRQELKRQRQVSLYLTGGLAALGFSLFYLLVRLL